MSKAKKEVMRRKVISVDNAPDGYGCLVEAEIKDGVIYVDKIIDRKPSKQVELSNCCNAHVYIDVDYECLICEKCQEPCSLGGKSFKEEKEATDTPD